MEEQGEEYKIEVHFKNTNKTVKIDNVTGVSKFLDDGIIVVFRNGFLDSIINVDEYTCITTLS